MSDAPEGFLITDEDIDELTAEDIEELEEISEEYVDLVEKFDEELDGILKRINESSAYEKLGVELHVSTEYVYSYGDRNES